MNARKLGRALVLGMALAAGSGAAFADGSLYERLRQMKVMDSNKDGMASKAEFMKMVEMAYDEKAKKMGIKGDKMTQSQLEEMLKALFYTGG